MLCDALWINAHLPTMTTDRFYGILNDSTTTHPQVQSFWR